MLLHADAVEAMLPADAIGANLLRLHAKDCHGRTWELLLRPWEAAAGMLPAHGRMLLLEQAAGFLKDRGARSGNLLVLTKAPGSPLHMEARVTRTSDSSLLTTAQSAVNCYCMLLCTASDRRRYFMNHEFLTCLILQPPCGIEARNELLADMGWKAYSARDARSRYLI